MTLRIDERSFENTAKALWIMNPSIKENYSDWMGLHSLMLALAHEYKWKPDATTLATYGFRLTYYPIPDGKACVASVTDSVAIRYAQESEYAMA